MTVVEIYPNADDEPTVCATKGGLATVEINNNNNSYNKKVRKKENGTEAKRREYSITFKSKNTPSISGLAHRYIFSGFVLCTSSSG